MNHMGTNMHLHSSLGIFTHFLFFSALLEIAMVHRQSRSTLYGSVVGSANAAQDGQQFLATSEVLR